ncbi:MULTISPECIES: thiamine pyrophosphate-dependent enzyme [Desulfotignum]|jgi:pyruvate/2-oxoacid:ferredoxin oxidoreductase beta subunit|uniref:Pyruvate synthase subunit PorB n=2 Tax=Desulfotignum TaxID=115780 RepID=S0G2V6_9BACT|nr:MULTISPECIES: thiamine pyrophosphate-dependent enzyme [Desulfotignum]EMS78076.1 pyruvate synthase subunit PorB [Desulfotignum phosphitoxidans DSM 13687]MBG0779091.1 pyruvate synthase subunit PorB [Desulfotignum balticum]
MAEKNKGRLTKVLDYLKYDDPFSKGVSFCPGCGLELLLRFIPRVLGNDIIITGTPSCSAPVLLGQNKQSWHTLSYFGTLMTGAAANATGLVRYYKKAGIDNTVVCFNGDGTANDIGFGNLSGAAERNEPFIYICYDNEGYMNTGIQKSGTTPYGATTTTTPYGTVHKGKNLRRMNLGVKMAMNKIPYTATATLSDLEDLAKKLLKAKKAKERGFCFLHVFAPCPTGWGANPADTIEICRQAVKTNYFPLWEAENGKIRMTKTVKKPKPVSSYTKLMKKFNHMTDADLQILQDDVEYETCLLGGLSVLEAECQLPVSAQD